MIEAKNLQKIAFFSDMDTKNVEEIAKFVEAMELPAGHILFKEGASCRDLFFVLEGRFDILVKMLVKTTPDYDTALTTIKSGEIVGELSFLDGAPRSATVQVKNDVKLIRIPYELINEYFENNPEFAYKFIAKISVILTKRVRNVNLMWRNSNPY